MSETTWTNSTIRKRLGEAGFLESRDKRVAFVPGVTFSTWTRGTTTVELTEKESDPPVLFDAYGRELDPNELGVRNINIQNTDVNRG